MEIGGIINTLVQKGISIEILFSPYPNNEPSSDTFNLRKSNTDPYYTT
ncbi:MAG: hypothetical protein KA206_09220 [Paludibacter sp.]|nr:hypothetical protein [Paludibacter sp.]